MAAFSGSNLTPSGIAAAEFPTSFRGYDIEAVRDFLNDVSTLFSELSEQSNSVVADSITTNQLRELKKENLRLATEFVEGGVNIIEVSTLQEALDAIEELGGNVDVLDGLGERLTAP